MLHQFSIAALATPPGQSALAVLRFSGPSCRMMIEKCFGDTKLQTAKMKLRQFKDPLEGKTLDEVLYCFFQGPNSYTGEDLVEIFPHGNPLIVKGILKAVLKLEDFRLAEPGEFTRRAFENGKMDLIQAESVAQLIHSYDLKSIENAKSLLEGELSQEINQLIDQVKFLSAKMELDIDFVEEEAEPDYESWKPEVMGMKNLLQRLFDSFSQNASKHGRKRVVLRGAPNAGKSSLINALVSEDRLIVSPIAGTTRDFIEVPFILPEGEVWIVDTAGLGEAIDELDAMSQKKTLKVLQEADLILHVIAPGTEVPKVESDKEMIVFSKSDLGAHESSESGFCVSSETGEGLGELKEALNLRLFDSNEEGLWLITERQKEAVAIAIDQMNVLLRLLDSNRTSIEELSFEMNTARNALFEITGEISSEDILNRLFAGFCIGK